MALRTLKSQPLARRQVEGNRPRDSVRQSPQASAPVDKTLTKGLQLLEALSKYERSRGISELAHELSLTKSNVHRLLQTLLRCGYVMREPSTERYLLSSKLWQVSRRARPFDALRRLVGPVLRDLVQETGESVVFVVVEHDDLIVIDQAQTQNPVRVVFFSIGQSFPIDRVVMMGKGLTALQLMALAHRPKAEARTVLQKVREQLGKGQSYINTQLSALSAIRADGFAVNQGEWVASANAVAVPVLDAAHNIVGILSCFGPADRLKKRDLKPIQNVLARTAQNLSQRLGT